MKKISFIIILVLVFPLASAGCVARENKATIEDANKSQPASVLSRALLVAELLEAGDMMSLSQYIHPLKGVRLTPYPYIDIQHDLVFTVQEVAKLMQDTQTKRWGVFDGTGAPIDLTFRDYYDQFVYDQDFKNPHIIGNNVTVSSGNTINNIDQVYPDSHFIEFHFTGFDPQYQGMDWSSLTLVFEELDDVYYLVGIIHGQWTI